MSSLYVAKEKYKRESSISGEIYREEGCLVCRNIKKDIKSEEARCRVFMWLERYIERGSSISGEIYTE